MLDGEIACIDSQGRPVFRDLRFRQSESVFVAFDLLILNGKDLSQYPRRVPSVERRRSLRKGTCALRGLQQVTDCRWTTISYSHGAILRIDLGGA